VHTGVAPSLITSVTDTCATDGRARYGADRRPEKPSRRAVQSRPMLVLDGGCPAKGILGYGSRRARRRARERSRDRSVTGSRSRRALEQASDPRVLADDRAPSSEYKACRCARGHFHCRRLAGAKFAAQANCPLEQHTPRHRPLRCYGRGQVVPMWFVLSANRNPAQDIRNNEDGDFPTFGLRSTRRILGG
jgi:hypothetical protein